MTRVVSIVALVLAVLAVLAVLGAAAQDLGGGDRTAEAVSNPDAAIEAYLADLGLDSVLAEHLRARLPETRGDARLAVAERLASIYAELLGNATSDDERRTLETMSR